MVLVHLKKNKKVVQQLVFCENLIKPASHNMDMSFSKTSKEKAKSTSVLSSSKLFIPRADRQNREEVFLHGT